LARISTFQSDPEAAYPGYSPRRRDDALRMKSIHSFGGRTAASLEFDLPLGLEPFPVLTKQSGLMNWIKAMIAVAMQIVGRDPERRGDAAAEPSGVTKNST
jgi:hypothetical protein